MGRTSSLRTPKLVRISPNMKVYEGLKFSFPVTPCPAGPEISSESSLLLDGLWVRHFVLPWVGLGRNEV